MRVYLGWRIVALAIAGLLVASGPVQGQIRKSQTAVITNGGESEDNELTHSETSSNRHQVVIQAIEPADESEHPGRKEVAWLGLATEEASEVVGAQLGLEPGVGLVVIYVNQESPAAKAGLQKNDVLVEFEGQALVHPAQLRKLVQVRKEGDKVTIAFYRAGKKETASVKLAKTKARLGLLDDGAGLEGGLLELKRQLRDLPIQDTIRLQMKTLRDSLGNLKIDQNKLQHEIQRSMEEARRAYQEALRHSTNAGAALGPLRKTIEGLARSQVLLDNDASVTVRSSGKAVKSMVKTDDFGTIVLLADPRLHLTAHDKEGRLVFDGEINTDAQRNKVPRDLWAKVEPLIEQMNAGKEKQAEEEEKP